LIANEQDSDHERSALLHHFVRQQPEEIKASELGLTASMMSP
jgi:hypothetical protein